MSRIASSSTVTLRGISFTNSNAIGGNGGPQAFNIGGGGGMGGNGGAGEGGGGGLGGNGGTSQSSRGGGIGGNGGLNFCERLLRDDVSRTSR